jgi:hypothetical protein
MRNRNGTRLRRMHELMVAAASSLKLPAIRLQKLDQLATLHRVYYTHDLPLNRMAAILRSGPSEAAVSLLSAQRRELY